MKFNPEEFGIKEDYLYEILATTISYNIQEKYIFPNTSCMGLKLLKDKNFLLKPFPNTKTYQNLKSNGYATINFVEDIYLYALAALKIPNSLNRIESFPEKYYDHLNISKLKILKEFFQNNLKLRDYRFPYIKRSWSIFMCRVNNEMKTFKKNELGEIELYEFELEILTCRKFRESHKLINRAENITLETIILATRLKVAHDKGNEKLISEIYNEIIKNKKKIERFSAKNEVIKSFSVINKYIKNYI